MAFCKVGITGSITQPDSRFGYSVFIIPLLYALAGILPQLVMYSQQELSIKEILLRKIIQLLLFFRPKSNQGTCGISG